MDFRDPIDRIVDPRPPEPAGPTADTSPGSTPATVALICGLAACVLNLAVITAPIGLLFGVIGLVFGIAARLKGSSARAGLVLTCISMLIVLIYAASVLVPLLADPTIRLYTQLTSLPLRG